MTNPPQGVPGGFDGGPPNGGFPPGHPLFRPQPGQIPSSMFLPPRPTAPEPPGGRFHGQPVEHEGVRFLFPLDTAIFHVMNRGYRKHESDGWMQPWEFPTRLTVVDLCQALGVRKGITECHEIGNGKWIPSQTIYPTDQRAGKKLEEVGWTADRGKTSKPVWIEILD